MKLSELFVELFFKADTMKLKEFVSTLGDLNMSSVMGVFGMDKLYNGIRKIMGAADESALSLNRFRATTGQSAQEFQRWDLWAEQMGAQAGTISSSINTLQDSITRLMVTGEGAPTWGLLGIDPTKYRKNYVELLKVLGEKFEGTLPEWQKLMLQQLGLPTDLLMILPKIKDGWADISKQLTVSNEQLVKMQEYHKVNAELGQHLKLLWMDIATVIEPVVSQVLKMADAVVRMTSGRTKPGEGIPEFFAGWMNIVPFGRRAAEFIKNPPAWMGPKEGEGEASWVSKDLRDVFRPAMSSNSRTQVFNSTFNIQGDNANDIAKQIHDIQQRERKNAEFNTPAGNY